MHLYFSGIGGAGIGPLALIAHQARYDVSGSDKQDNNYIHYLQQHGVTNIHIGQSYDQIAAVHAQQPIDWLIYSSAITREQTDAPELRFCQEHGIKTSKRDEFLGQLLQKKHLKLIAVAGTHGKTTTTAMAIWLFKQLHIPVSYSVGAKLSFGDMGEYDSASEYFIYECDEFDRNFLAFHPHLSMIAGIDWDHPDIYPTEAAYNEAFRQFLRQSDKKILWQIDIARLALASNTKDMIVIQETNTQLQALQLAGLVNRRNAFLVATAVHELTGKPLGELIEHLNRFPGVSRRFEQIAPHIYTDYAHTPPKIRGALQIAHETAGDNVVVVYEGLHNTRQHFIKDELRNLFAPVKKLYIVPSYLAREDPHLALLSPEDLKQLMTLDIQAKTEPAQLDDHLQAAIQRHANDGDLVLCLSGGGGHSLDEWLRTQFA